MALHKVVIHKMQGQSPLVVLGLLGEGVGEPRKASHMHPHREVVPLNVRGRNIVGVRYAPNRGANRFRDDHRAILGVSAFEWYPSVNLDLGPVVGAGEQGFDRVNVGAEAIRRNFGLPATLCARQGHG